MQAREAREARTARVCGSGELRSELMSGLEESARRLHVYESAVYCVLYCATNSTACRLARDMWYSEHEYFARLVWQLRELLEQWSDESM